MIQEEHARLLLPREQALSGSDRVLENLLAETAQ
jgi:hypothetical protein